MSLLAIALCTVVSFVLLVALGVLTFDRWAERERRRQEWHIVQRLRFDELVRGGRRS